MPKKKTAFQKLGTGIAKRTRASRCIRYGVTCAKKPAKKKSKR